MNLPLSSLKSLYAIPIGLSGANVDSFNQYSNTKSYTAGKILVVDDEKFNCDIIEGFLMILGFVQWKEQTIFAYNGEQAVDEIKKSIAENDSYRFSLILMDCNMPFLDGYEATK